MHPQADFVSNNYFQPLEEMEYGIPQDAGPKKPLWCSGPSCLESSHSNPSKRAKNSRVRPLGGSKQEPIGFSPHSTLQLVVMEYTSHSSLPSWLLVNSAISSLIQSGNSISSVLHMLEKQDFLIKTCKCGASARVESASHRFSSCIISSMQEECDEFGVDALVVVLDSVSQLPRARRFQGRVPVFFSCPAETTRPSPVDGKLLLRDLTQAQKLQLQLSLCIRRLLRDSSCPLTNTVLINRYPLEGSESWVWFCSTPQLGHGAPLDFVFVPASDTRSVAALEVAKQELQLYSTSTDPILLFTAIQASAMDASPQKSEDVAMLDFPSMPDSKVGEVIQKLLIWLMWSPLWLYDMSHDDFKISPQFNPRISLYSSVVLSVEPGCQTLPPALQTFVDRGTLHVEAAHRVQL